MNIFPSHVDRTMFRQPLQFIVILRLARSLTQLRAETEQIYITAKGEVFREKYAQFSSSITQQLCNIIEIQ